MIPIDGRSGYPNSYNEKPSNMAGRIVNSRPSCRTVLRQRDGNIIARLDAHSVSTASDFDPCPNKTNLLPAKANVDPPGEPWHTLYQPRSLIPTDVQSYFSRHHDSPAYNDHYSLNNIMSTRTLRSRRLFSPNASSSKSRPSPSSQSGSKTTATLADRKRSSVKPSSAAAATTMPRYFLIVASRDHLRTAVEGGFCQANHGKKAPIMQMKKGDGVVFYSAKETYTPKSKGKPGGKACQKFTGMGRVKDDDVYQVRVTGTFEPHRRNVDFDVGKEVSILPLIEKLDFIRDKTHWGASLRFGFLKITEADWELIQSKMQEE